MTDSILVSLDRDLLKIVQSRRTIGAFRSELPDRSLILEALEAARWAPNHKKTEPWRVYWLGRETANAISELNAKIVAESKGPEEAESKRKKWSAIPGWMAITCKRSDDEIRQQEDYAATCCFLQNLMLVLWSGGIGTKWSSGAVIRHPQFFQLLGSNSETERVVGLLWYGYPAIVPNQTRSDVATFLVERE
ncbi:MAG: nitroreductase [Planctomycetes bacterium]|nr:nitroreductase [Planctomycetota bacterium]